MVLFDAFDLDVAVQKKGKVLCKGMKLKTRVFVVWTCVWHHSADVTVGLASKNLDPPICLLLSVLLPTMIVRVGVAGTS